MTTQQFQRATVFSIAIFVSFNVLSQEGGIKFGKIDKQYLEMDTYEADTSANAAVLADY